MNEILFKISDISKERQISPESARVFCARKTKTGKLIRLKNNLYISGSNWDKLTWDDQLKLASWIQTPSYISFLTALAYYELTTQIPVGRIDSAAKTRTYSKEVKGIAFVYIKLDPRLYFGFEKKNGCFIATPEKALADSLYLSSLGKYALDFSAIEWEKINADSFNRLLKKYPKQTRKWWLKHAPL